MKNKITQQMYYFLLLPRYAVYLVGHKNIFVPGAQGSLATPLHVSITTCNIRNDIISIFTHFEN